MKLSPERKRLAYLVGALVLLGGYSLYTNVLSGPSSSTPSRPTAKSSPAPQAGPSYPEKQPGPPRLATSSRSSEEFRPSLKPKRPEDRVDPMSIDPTLRLDLLAKVQSVNIEGGRRNLFQVGAPPLPPEPTVTMKQDAQVAQMGPQLPPGPPLFRSITAGADRDDEAGCTGRPDGPATSPWSAAGASSAASSAHHLEVLRLLQRPRRQSQTRLLPRWRRYSGGRRR